MVRPDVALITNIEAVHLEFFPSITAIADAKAEIFLGMTTGGSAVLNRDNAHFVRLDDAACHQGLHRIVGFGRDAIAEACLMNYEPTPEGGMVQAEILGRPMRYRIGAPGEHLALNSLGALLAISLAGGDMVAASAALANYHPPKGRGVAETVRLPDGDITLIDESYNASPVAVRAAIRLLGTMKPAGDGRRIMVLGDMRELGPTSPNLHADLATDLEQGGVDRVYCCGEMMAHLFEALPPALRGFHAKDSAALAPHVASEIQAGDIVTVKGSKTTHMEKVIETIRERGAQKQKRVG
jgi:UDP-N-acetylmuramoyl-tripeptide--D-alanyl-D-alanine ligase